MFCTTFTCDRTHFLHHSAFLSFVAFALIIVFRTRFTCERDSGQTTCGLLHAWSLFLSSLLSYLLFRTQFTCERSRSDHVRTVAHLQLAHYYILPWWVFISYEVHVRTGLPFPYYYTLHRCRMFRVNSYEVHVRAGLNIQGRPRAVCCTPSTLFYAFFFFFFFFY